MAGEEELGLDPVDITASAVRSVAAGTASPDEVDRQRQTEQEQGQTDQDIPPHAAV